MPFFEFLAQFALRYIAYIIFQESVDNVDIAHKTC